MNRINASSLKSVDNLDDLDKFDLMAKQDKCSIRAKSSLINRKSFTTKVSKSDNDFKE